MNINHKGKCMRINNITNCYNKPSFGLKIKKDEGFQNFIKYARRKNCGAKPNEISEFIREIENMHYNNDDANSTEIVFWNISKDSIKLRVPIFEECFCEEILAGYKTRRDTIHTINYSFYNNKNKKYKNCIARIKDKTLNLKDVLTLISQDYSNFSKNE